MACRGGRKREWASLDEMEQKSSMEVIKVNSDEQRLIEACLAVPADVETAKALLEKGVSPNISSDVEYSTSLLFDILGEYWVDREENHPYLKEAVEVMKLLIQHGAETVDKWDKPIIFEMEWLPDSPCTYDFIKFLLNTVSTPFDVWEPPETIYDNICYETFNGLYEDFNFYKNFLQILIAFGAAPKIDFLCSKDERKQDLRQFADLEKYATKLELCEDGQHVRVYIIEAETGKPVLRV